jgi:hypothetical protein
MYYRPPKSSIWGHSLRKMKPALQRERLDEFFIGAVCDYSFSSGSVTYLPFTSRDSLVRTLSSLARWKNSITRFNSHFMELLGVSDSEYTLSNLSEAQFEVCFQELLSDSSLFESGKYGVSLIAYYDISSWRVGDKTVETDSSLGVHYGARPWLSTTFGFDSMEVFYHLRETLESAGLCRLNPKHIKGRKKSKSSQEAA